MNVNEFRNRNRQILREFIKMYESFPCLWNIKSKEYHDRKLRTIAYRALAKKLQELQPGADRGAVVRKINSLRSNHRKEMRKTVESAKSGRVYKTNLWYYNMFDFLKGRSTCVKDESHLYIEDLQSYKSDEETKSDPLGSQMMILEDSYPEPESPTYECVAPASREENQPGSSFMVHNDANTSGPVYNEANGVSQEVEKDGEDRHDFFGKNVAMKLRHLSSTNDTQRLMAEKIINDALYMGEMGSLTQQHLRLLQ